MTTFLASFCPGKKILYRQSRLSWLQVGFHSFLLQQEAVFALNQISTRTLTKQLHMALKVQLREPKDLTDRVFLRLLIGPQPCHHQAQLPLQYS